MTRTTRVGWIVGLTLCLWACGSDEPANNAQSASSSSGTGASKGEGGGGSGGIGGGGAGGSGGEDTDPRFDALIDAIEKERKQLDVPGVAVAIIEDGEVTFARGFGSKDPNAEVAVEPTTLFRLGSVNKMLTAAAVMHEVDAGRVELNSPVIEYVPNFKLNTDPTWAPTITIEHLLTHQSGMYDYLEIDTPASQHTDEALETFMTGAFGNLGFLMSPAGAFFNYSNPNYYLAGLVAEKTSGKHYRELMRENVFEPLDMTRTFFLGSDVLADGDYAIGRSTYPDVPEIVLPDTYENAWARPAGYATSSVLDMGKFVKFLLDGNESVLSEGSVEAMQSPHVSEDILVDVLHYGYGLGVSNGLFIGSLEDFYDLRVVSHQGAIPGFSADVLYIPSLRFGFIALANGDNGYFDDSRDVALKTLANLPAKSTPPDLEVDPTTWVDLTGTFEDPYNAGDMHVTLDNNELHVEIPMFDTYNIPYDTLLTPYSRHTFLFEVQGFLLPMTFIPAKDSGDLYLRTRIFVGTRPETPPMPDMAARKLVDEGTRAQRVAHMLARLKHDRGPALPLVPARVR